MELPAVTFDADSHLRNAEIDTGHEDAIVVDDD
ncbi:MAG: hypothetical protein QOJ08_2107, partial [Ilumatobacteraceae bacterium]